MSDLPFSVPAEGLTAGAMVGLLFMILAFGLFVPKRTVNTIVALLEQRAAKAEEREALERTRADLADKRAEVLADAVREFTDMSRAQMPYVQAIHDQARATGRLPASTDGGMG